MSSTNPQLCVDNCDGEYISAGSCLATCLAGHYMSSASPQLCVDNCDGEYIPAGSWSASWPDDLRKINAFMVLYINRRTKVETISQVATRLRGLFIYRVGQGQMSWCLPGKHEKGSKKKYILEQWISLVLGRSKALRCLAWYFVARRSTRTN